MVKTVLTITFVAVQMLPLSLWVVGKTQRTLMSTVVSVSTIIR
jgi:hypothetical protein